MRVSIISFYTIVAFGSLVFGFQYGEGLLSSEYITRLDYLVMFLFGFFCSLSLFTLLTYRGRRENNTF